MTQATEKVVINTDKARLNLKVIHEFLTQSYWAKGVTLDNVRKAIEHSLCFGVYYDAEQAGFARVITDYARIAYLADVFVLEQFRGRGLSKQLMATIMAHPQLQEIQKWFLATADAHGLYRQFGFVQPADVGKFMEKLMA